MGQPGAGKGVQAELLSEKLNLYSFETSKVLEEKFNSAKKNEYSEIDGKKYFISDEKKLWSTGALCSSAFVAFLVKEKIKKLFERGEGLVFSGSPRSLYEAEELIPFLRKLYRQKNIKIFFLEITPEETMWRNSHRRICELMRHSILFSKETEKLKKCCLDGSKLVRRGKLDDLETIKKRLEEYREKTYPLLEFYKKENLKVIKINGSPPPAIVFKNILKKLKF